MKWFAVGMVTAAFGMMLIGARQTDSHDGIRTTLISIFIVLVAIFILLVS